MEQPKIPTLKDTKPQLKIRGLGTGLTLMERLKQFKKKDLAFIMAGLGTLFMAPLAEHFMMSPESADGQLTQGWGGRGPGSGSNLFGSGGSPYEPGTSGMAPGSAIGGGGDIITPLNVRDPSALVMGPGATQQPPTSSAAPQTPPPSAPVRSDSDLKDALAASSRGVSAAAKKAPIPLPKVALGGSGLRGLGVAGGGSSSSAGLGPISAGNVPNRGSTGGGLSTVNAAPGYKGLATRGPGQGSGSGIDALRKAADNAASVFNRGSASSGLTEAAKTDISGALGHGFGGHGPGDGGKDKGFGGNQDRGSKSLGESLAFLERKQRMEKELEREYKLKEKNDLQMFMADQRNKFAETMIQDLGKGFSKWFVGNTIGMLPSDKPTNYACVHLGSGKPVPYIPASKVATSPGECDADGKDDKAKRWFYSNGALYNCQGNKEKEYEPCTVVGKAPEEKKADDKGDGVGNTTPPAGATDAQKARHQSIGLMNSLNQICTTVSVQAKDKVTDKGASHIGAGRVLVNNLDALTGDGGSACSEASGVPAVRQGGQKTVKASLDEMASLLGKASGSAGDLDKLLAQLDAETDKPDFKPMSDAVEKFNKALAEWNNSGALLDQVESNLSQANAQIEALSTDAADAPTKKFMAGSKQQLKDNLGRLRDSHKGLKDARQKLGTGLKEIGFALGYDEKTKVFKGEESTVRRQAQALEELRHARTLAKERQITEVQAQAKPYPAGDYPQIDAAMKDASAQIGADGKSGATQAILKIPDPKAPAAAAAIDPAALENQRADAAKALGEATAKYKASVRAQKEWIQAVAP